MSVAKSKIKKLNTYDILDCEELEKYLSHMALEGWLVKDISNVFITFEKQDPRVMKFFVDITDKKIEGDNYLASKEYKENLKEKNLEYICGNDIFQIFINNGSTIEVDKKKLKLRKIFINEFGMAFSIILSLLPFIYFNSMSSRSFKYFISSNLLILWLVIILISLVGNGILVLLKFIKYKKNDE